MTTDKRTDAALTIAGAALLASAGTIASDNANPDEILARLSPIERRAALWRRTGIVAVFSEDYRRELIAEASAQHIEKRSK